MSDKLLLPGPQKQGEPAAKARPNGGAAPQVSPPGDLEEKLSRPISSLKLNGLPKFSRNRTLNLLRNIPIKTLGDLVKLSERELRNIKYLGNENPGKTGKTMEVLKAELAEIGLRPGMFSEPEGPEPKPLPDEERLNNLALRWDRLKIDKRIISSLSNAGIKYVYELAQKAEGDIISLDFMGEKSLQKIKEFLAELGLSPGMQLEQGMLDDIRSRIDRSGPKTSLNRAAIPQPVPELDEKQLRNLARPVKELEVEPEMKERMKKIKVKYVYQLVQKTESGLLKQRKFGKRTIKQMNEILSELGLRFDMQLDKKTLRKVREKMPKVRKSTPRPESPPPVSSRKVDTGRVALVEGMPKAYATVNNALVVRTNLSREELQELLDLALRLEPFKGLIKNGQKEMLELGELLSSLESGSLKALSKVVGVLAQDKGFSLGKK